MSLPVTFHRIGEIDGVASAERRCGRLAKLRGELPGASTCNDAE